MRIFYLSTTSFADCEIALLNDIGKTETVKYGVIIPKKNNNYTEAELRREVDASVVSLLPVQLKYRFRDIRQVFVYLKLFRQIWSFKPDVVYINFFHDVCFNFLSLLFLKSRTTVIGLHDVMPHSGLKNSSLLNFIQQATVKKFKNILTFSKSQMDFLKQGHSNHQVFNIPLMLKDFGGVKTGKPDYSTINFLFFGNIKSYKGLDVLLYAIQKIQANYSNFTLTIAGRCSDWDTFYQPLIKDSGNIKSSVRFIRNEEIPGFFANAHYLILPYKDVTQSGPLMIAYNYGLPVIASNIGGFKEFIEEGKTGFLFENMDVASLQTELENAITRSEEDYTKLIAGVEKYKQQYFAPSKIKNSYLCMFRNVIGVTTTAVTKLKVNIQGVLK